MGFQNVKPIETQEERNRIIHYILRDIKALEKMLDQGLIEKDIHRIGAEQEFCLTDNSFHPAFNALEVLEKINDPHFTTEIALFNLEINLDPLELSGNCFSEMKGQLYTLMEKAYDSAAKVDDTKVVLTGILPTLISKDIAFENITPFDRYRTLNKILSDIKKEDFRLYIKGIDELFVKHRTILFEACNTSFQIHLQIDPDEAVQMYNWSQMIAGPVLSIATNSPILMNRELWSETRIALFQQSIDTRNTTYLLHEERPRVDFGHEWVKDSIIELYKDDLARYPILMTTDEINEDAPELLNKGMMPQLQALNLHNGTLYKWNRMCYGVDNNIAHLRIENRYIPSGPTLDDEIANMLFWIGLMQGMPDNYSNFWNEVNFKDVKGNFNNAAQVGIEATFNWFDKSYTARKLIRKLLIPMARKGLEKHQVAQKDIDYYLGLISQRISKNINGSKWMTRSYRNLQKNTSKSQASVILTKGMHDRQRSGKPVTEWDLVSKEEGIDILKNDKTVDKLMSTHLFAVNENDPIKLVIKVSDWKKIKHLPVVNNDQNIVGYIDVKHLHTYLDNNEIDKSEPVKDLMIKSVVMISKDTSASEATQIFKDQNTSCLFIMENNQLVGLLTRKIIKKSNKNL